MLESVFGKAETIEWYRQNPLGAYLDTYVRHLGLLGYGRQSIRGHLHLITKLGLWMKRRGLGTRELDIEVLRRFLAGRAKKHQTARLSEAAAARRFLRHVSGFSPVTKSRLFETDSRELIRLRSEYRTYLLSERGLSARSWRSQWYVIRKFLTRRFQGRPLRLARISAADVTKHFQSLRTGKRRIQTDASALRSFFRYLLAKNRISANLAESVPCVSAWRDVGLPKYLPAEQVERVLRSCDRQTELGRRDYAILLLMARLGLRGTEIVALELDDIDWRAGQLLIRGKGQVRQGLPLLKDVGAAIAAYISHARRSPTRRLFVVTKAPRYGFVNAQAVNYVFAQALKRAGIEAPARNIGSHALRHSLATSMLRRGASLSEISEVLRHKSTNSTTIYAKVDIDGLRSLAQPWPTPSLVRRATR